MTKLYEVSDIADIIIYWLFWNLACFCCRDAHHGPSTQGLGSRLVIESQTSTDGDFLG